MKPQQVKSLVLCALFAALTAVCSQLQIPLPMIPINLALFAVNLCGALTSKSKAALAMAAYMLMGVIGLPVFTGLRGGAGVLFGRTGGYILGYIASAFLISLILEKWGRAFWKMCLAMAAGTAGCYAFGTVWFMVLTGNGLWASLTICVFPFLLGDAVKILLAAFLAGRLEKPLRRVLA